jgi:hypothetical protein
MLNLRPIALGVMLATVPALARHAQAQGPLPSISLEGSVLYNTFQGRDFRNVNDGGGFEAQANIGVGAFSLGGGYLRTTHSITGIAEDAVQSGPYLEPRLALPFYYTNFTPYLMGRVARITHRVDTSLGERESTGTSVGGGVGMLVRLTPGVQLNMGLLYSSFRLGRIEQGGTTVTGSGGDGTTLGFRAGLSLGGGGWGVR